MDAYTVRPIGTVQSPFERPGDVPAPLSASVEAAGTVEVFDRYADGLAGIEGFSHVVLVTYLHLAGETLRVDPPYSEDRRLGIFATRGPNRPNPIGITVVRLRGVDGTTLEVEGVDLVDGTPLLDLRPHAPKPIEREPVETGWLDQAG